jgi:hypothetical protein
LDKKLVDELNIRTVTQETPSLKDNTFLPSDAEIASVKNYQQVSSENRGKVHQIFAEKREFWFVRERRHRIPQVTLNMVLRYPDSENLKPAEKRGLMLVIKTLWSIRMNEVIDRMSAIQARIKIESFKSEIIVEMTCPEFAFDKLHAEFLRLMDVDG